MNVMIQPNQWFDYWHKRGEHAARNPLQKLVHSEVLWIIVGMLLFLVLVAALTLMFGMLLPYVPPGGNVR